MFFLRLHWGPTLLLVVACAVVGYLVAWPVVGLALEGAGLDSLIITSPAEPILFKLRMAASLALAPLLACGLNLLHRTRAGAELRVFSFLALSGALIAAVGVGWGLHALWAAAALDGPPAGLTLTPVLSLGSLRLASWGALSAGAAASVGALVLVSRGRRA
jgi:hypothetical protein